MKENWKTSGFLPLRFSVHLSHMTTWLFVYVWKRKETGRGEGKASTRVSKKEFMHMFCSQLDKISSSPCQPGKNPGLMLGKVSLMTWTSLLGLLGNDCFWIGTGCCLDDNICLEFFPIYESKAGKVIGTVWCSDGFSLEVEHCTDAMERSNWQIKTMLLVTHCPCLSVVTIIFLICRN